MTKVDDRDLFTSYKSIKDRMIYNKAQDKMAELLISDKIKKKRPKKSGTNKDKINSSEMK